MDDMRAEYDFTDSLPNPYIKRLKKAVTIRLDATTIEYFKALSGKTAIPYQTLMNLYLTDCANHKRQPDLAWN